MNVTGVIDRFPLGAAVGRAEPNSTTWQSAFDTSVDPRRRSPNWRRELGHQNKPLWAPDAASPATSDVTPLYTASRWLANAMGTLERLRGSCTFFEDVAPPNEICINQSRHVLEALAEIDLQPKFIDPSADEGVCISFRVGRRYADIECFNTGEIVATIIEGLLEPRVWMVSRDELAATVAQIDRFIRG